MLQYDSRQHAALRTTVANEGGASRVQTESPQAALDDPYYRQLHGFLEAVRFGKPTPVSPYDGHMAMSIACAALESAKTGQVVSPVRD
jgi:predicted dehydrogenase